MTLRIWFQRALVAAALVLSLPRFVAAQDDAFKEGMKAIDDRKWAEAATQMHRAIQGNPADSRRQVEYGGFIGVRKNKVEYLPNYYLGEALFESQDCAGAVDAWATAEKQGAVNATPEFVRKIQNGFIVCETKGVLSPAKFDPLNQRAKDRYNEVRSLAQNVANMARQDSDAFRQDLRDQYTSGTAELNNASNALSSAQRTRAQKEFDTANAAVDKAQSILNVVQTSLRASIDSRLTADSLTRDIEGALGKADDLERQVNALIADKKLTLPAPLAAIRDGGRDSLSRAHDRFAAGTKNQSIPALTDARNLVTEGTGKYRQVLDELGRQERDTVAKKLQDAIAGADQALLYFDGLNGTLGRRIAAKPALVDDGVTAERDKIVKEVDGVRRRLSAAKSSSNLDGITKANGATVAASAHLSALLSRFGPLTLRERGITEALEAGARQFFAGQYDKVLVTLNAPEALAPDAPLQLHVHLFRAASLHAQLSRSPKNDALRGQALAEVAECKKLDSMFEPDPRAFSPGFVKFFKSGS